MEDPWKEVNDAKAEYEAKVRAIGQDKITEIVRQVFHEMDKTAGGTLVECVSWTQYTPYFNDGDPCEFGVNDPLIGFGPKVESILVAAGLHPEDEYERDDEESGLFLVDCIRRTFVDGNYDHDAWKARGYGPDDIPRLAPEPFVDPFTLDTIVAAELLDKTISDIPEDVMLSAFGDHARVHISRAGITVTEYSHD